MANIFKSLLDAMKFSDDDEDSYDDYVNSYNEKAAKRLERENASKKPAETKPVSVAPSKPAVHEDSKPRIISDKGRVIPVRTTKDFELKVVKPTGFSDCQDICDILLGGDACVINLEGFDSELSQRIMDFVSGTVYAIRGSLSPVSRLIYIVSPENVSISGDVMNLLTNGGVEAPKINTDF